jgi:hypothetical protein
VPFSFVDRWPLADRDPTAALPNQLRRRMKVDIRDPDLEIADLGSEQRYDPPSYPALT